MSGRRQSVSKDASSFRAAFFHGASVGEQRRPEAQRSSDKRGRKTREGCWDRYASFIAEVLLGRFVRLPSLFE